MMGQGLSKQFRWSADVGAVDWHAAVPLRHDGWDRQIAGRDGASGGVAGSIDDGARGNVAESKGVVESEHRFPVDGFVDQAGAAASARSSFAVHVPGKAQARGEVLVIGVVGAADAVIPA